MSKTGNRLKDGNGSDASARSANLAEKHTGMRISALGYLQKLMGKRGRCITTEDRFFAGEMSKHLKEMATRFYAGDVKAVDEFLQLYALDDKRPNVKALTSLPRGNLNTNTNMETTNKENSTAGSGLPAASCSVVEDAWKNYHGPMQIDGEEDYIPAVPPIFMRGFADGCAYAEKQVEIGGRRCNSLKMGGCILPCPFCGSAELGSGDNWSCGEGYVNCSSCGVTMISKTEESAIEKWNTRLD